MGEMRKSGSVYLRKDGRWVASITKDGKRISKYARSREAAEALLRKLLAANAPPSTLTLEGWVEKWLGYEEGRLRPSTLRTYRQTLSIFTDAAGSLPLAEVTPLVLQDAIAEAQRNRGYRRLSLAARYIRRCLDRAVALGLLGTNPARAIVAPAYHPKERELWSLDQARTFITSAAASTRKYAPLFVLLASVGLRISEALALEWSDVDTAAGRLSVSKALVWAGSTWSVQLPKTKAGRRTVSLPATTATTLSRMPGKKEGPVFRTEKGNPPYSATLRNALADQCREAGVPYVNVHGLRHVAAMLALEATGDAYIVQRRLGHASVQITLGIYGYSAKEDDSIIAAINQLLDAKPSGA